MLRKDTPVSYTRPMSTMRQVLHSVEVGNGSRQSIARDTGLGVGQVQAALYNLTFVGALRRTADDNGCSVYHVPGLHFGVAACLKGISSIFSFTKCDNRISP